MKNVLFVALTLVVLGLTACGGGNGSNSETTSDSTLVDSTALTAVDSTTAQIPTDSVSTK